jgi:hydrogenase expression/formation protein HypE
MIYPPGKLPLDVLDHILSTHTQSTDPRVLVGPGIGEDAAVIDFGDTYLVAKTDPITFATDDIGRYAIHVNANDIATMGAIPRWFLVTVLLPEHHTDDTLLAEIFSSLPEAAEEIDIAICGGHKNHPTSPLVIVEIDYTQHTDIACIGCDVRSRQ